MTSKMQKSKSFFICCVFWECKLLSDLLTLSYSHRSCSNIKANVLAINTSYTQIFSTCLKNGNFIIVCSEISHLNLKFCFKNEAMVVGFHWHIFGVNVGWMVWILYHLSKSSLYKFLCVTCNALSRFFSDGVINGSLVHIYKHQSSLYLEPRGIASVM